MTRYFSPSKHIQIDIYVKTFWNMRKNGVVHNNPPVPVVIYDDLSNRALYCIQQTTKRSRIS